MWCSSPFSSSLLCSSVVYFIIVIHLISGIYFDSACVCLISFSYPARICPDIRTRTYRTGLAEFCRCFGARLDVESLLKDEKRVLKKGLIQTSGIELQTHHPNQFPVLGRCPGLEGKYNKCGQLLLPNATTCVNKVIRQRVPVKGSILW